MVFLLEDGTILLAEAEGEDISPENAVTEEDSLSGKRNAEEEKEKKVDKELAGQLSYTGLNVSGLKVKSDKTQEEKDAAYRYFELYDKTKFIYGISTISDSQTKRNMVK